MALTSVAVPHAPEVEIQITVRRVDGVDEYRQCERLQDVVWGPDDIAGVPLLDLLTAQENGGIVLGAFTADRELTGFVYSFPGLTPSGRLKQCSIILCVHPAYRRRGLARQLKLAQRREALARGIELITWTFDPLLAANALLNIRRLGAIARDYRVNLYDSGRGLNAGLDTDRLLVEWWLRRTPWPEPETEWPGSPCEALVNDAGPAAPTGLLADAPLNLEADEQRVLISIPPDLSALKRSDLGLAQRWRADTRRLFETYFARGYVVVDFRRSVWPSGLPAYVLQRRATS
jgi:chorismate synthase